MLLGLGAALLAVAGIGGGATIFFMDVGSGKKGPAVAQKPGDKDGKADPEKKDPTDAQQKAPDKSSGAKKTDAEKLVGVWRLTKAEIDGNDPVPPVVSALARWSLAKGGKLEMTVGKSKHRGTYKVIEMGKLDLAKESYTGIQAIMRFDSDDQLTVCLSAGKPGRPTEFSGGKDKGQAMFVFKRANAGDEKPSDAELAKFKNELEGFYEEQFQDGTTMKLKLLVLGMHNHLSREKAFPTHAIYSKDGKMPLLSWRVAILPDIGEMDLYKEFKLDEPWNSTHNKKLIAKMPDHFQDVNSEKNDGKTPFQLFTGPNTVFGSKKGLSFPDLLGGSNNTVFIVEGKNSVTWTEPADLSMPKEKDKLPALGGTLKKGFLAAMGDGHIQLIPYTTTAAELRALISPTGKD